MTLRTRLLAGLGLVVVVLAVALTVITERTEDQLVAQLDAQLERAVGPASGATAFGSGSSDVPPPPTASADDEVPTGPPSGLSFLYIGVIADGELRTVLEPGLAGDDAVMPTIDVDEVVERSTSPSAFTVGSSDPEVRYRARASVDPVTGEVVVVALSLAQVDAAVDNLVAVELVGAAVILLTLAAVAWWVIRLGIRPVQDMTAVAGAIAAGDLSQRVPEVDRRTEAGALGASLNRMLASIEEAFDERSRAEARLRQFVADASHELRTPVATIRGYAELYRTGALAAVDALDDAMRRTEQEAIRMGGLVEDLLSLARLDEGLPLERGPVDLAAVAADAAADASAVQPRRRISVDAGEPGTRVVVRADEAKIRQVVANLVGNALVHTPDTADIVLRVRRSGERGVLEVEDHGPGMEAEAAARAFERFYRADPSRSRHRGGSGLGLAIVDATVRAHGGRVLLTSVLDRGTTVTVELPLEAEDAAGMFSGPSAPVHSGL